MIKPSLVQELAPGRAFHNFHILGGPGGTIKPVLSMETQTLNR